MINALEVDPKFEMAKKREKLFWKLK